MATKKKAATAPATIDKARNLTIVGDGTKSIDRLMAEVVARGVVSNAATPVRFGKAEFGELSLNDCMQVLKEPAKAVHGGDLSAAETMLTAQAVALNAMFGELARRAALNMGEYLDASEKYMRLALKAQGQCRSTLETLAVIKNPPVVFARQANINHGGQQQVNNGTPLPQVGPGPVTSHAEQSSFEPNKLLEGQHESGTHRIGGSSPGECVASGNSRQS